jgi:hypothetical protein
VIFPVIKNIVHLLNYSIRPETHANVDEIVNDRVFLPYNSGMVFGYPAFSTPGHAGGRNQYFLWRNTLDGISVSPQDNRVILKMPWSEGAYFRNMPRGRIGECKYGSTH